MKHLLVISSAPAAMIDGKPFLDTKFVEGMRLYADLWDGSVSCILTLQDSPSPFGRIYDRAELPFSCKFITHGTPIGMQEIY